GGGQGLVAAGHVDDGEAAAAQGDASVGEESLVVRAAVDERGQHAAEHGLRGQGTVSAGQDAADAAHGPTLGSPRAEGQPTVLASRPSTAERMVGAITSGAEAARASRLGKPPGTPTAHTPAARAISTSSGLSPT